MNFNQTKQSKSINLSPTLRTPKNTPSHAHICKKKKRKTLEFQEQTDEACDRMATCRFRLGIGWRLVANNPYFPQTNQFSVIQWLLLIFEHYGIDVKRIKFMFLLTRKSIAICYIKMQLIHWYYYERIYTVVVNSSYN